MGMNGGSAAVPLGGELSHALAGFLASAAECDELEVLALEPLPGGAARENYAVDAAVRGGPREGRLELVVRADAPAGRARSEEYALLAAAFAAGVTVPEPLWVCPDESLIGRAFYVMRRLPGVAAGDRLVRDASLEPVREQLVERLGEELARLHGVRPPYPGLEFLPEPDFSPALRRVVECRVQLDALPDPQPVLEWALRWLERAAPPRADLVLCHGDFRTGNYLVHEGRLTGILDWERASWGDPAEDLAWFCARCARFGQWQREAGGLGSREAFYRGYERASGTTVDRELIPYWEVMATVRLAVMALQQGERHAAGEEPSLALALGGRSVPEMELDVLLQMEAIRAES